MQVCTLLQTDNHASTPPLFFLQAGCPSCCPANSAKALIQSTLSTFKLHLKFLSSSLPLPSSHPMPAPPIRSHNFWRYINLYVRMSLKQGIFWLLTCCKLFSWVILCFIKATQIDFVNFLLPYLL